MRVGNQRKRLVKFGALSVLAIVALGGGGGLVTAQTTSEQDTDDTAKTTLTDTETTLEERVNTRKNARSLRLSAAQQARLRSRCQAAQGLLTAYEARVKTLERNRVNAYDKIHDHLTSLLERLNGQVDTAELTAAIENLEAQVTAFQQHLNDYHQVITDLAAMDCTADPTGFRASLDTAKEQRSDLLSESAVIRTYIQDTLRPILQDIKAELQANRGEVIN